MVSHALLNVYAPTSTLLDVYHYSAAKADADFTVQLHARVSSTRSSRHCLRSSDSNKLVMPPVKLST